MTNKIDTTKKYQTKSGKPAKVYSINNGGVYPVHGAILDESVWQIENWTDLGKFTYTGASSQEDLIEYDPYTSFKEDDKVLYQLYDGGEWIRGYFSHVDNGIPKVFYAGRTSFTNLEASAVSTIKHYQED